MPILITVLVLLAVAALTIMLGFRAPSVSLKFLNYTQSPHGAILRLTNGTPSTIKYLTRAYGLDSGVPILRQVEISNGWTNESSAVMPASGATGKTNVIYFLRDIDGPLKRHESLRAAQLSELKPGGSVDFFIRLYYPDDPHIRVGTVCLVPQTRFTKALQPYLARIRQWCRMKPPTPGQIEVWCPTSLQMPPPPPPPPPLN